MTILGVTASSILKDTGDYESIATITPSGSQANVIFSSIPNTYKHLQIRMSVRNLGSTNDVGSIKMRLNNIATANYAYHYMEAKGTQKLSGGTAQTESYIQLYDASMQGGATASFHAFCIVDILNYTSTNKKTVRYRASSNLQTTNERLAYGSGFFDTSSAISQIELIEFDNWAYATSSRFDLYGVKQ